MGNRHKRGWRRKAEMARKKYLKKRKFQPPIDEMTARYLELMKRIL